MRFLTKEQINHHKSEGRHHGRFHGHRGHKAIIIDDSTCSRCGNCVRTCTQNVFERVNDGKGSHIEVKNPENCTHCRECFAACKFDALLLAHRPTH